MKISTREKLIIKDGTFEYLLTRSSARRRTMEIHIRPEGVVEVHAPRSFSLAAVEGFLKRKARWVLKKLSMFEDRRRYFEEKSAGVKQCYYLGINYPIRQQIDHGRWGRIHFNDEGWMIGVPGHIPDVDEFSRQFLMKWFKSRAQIVLKQRVDHYGRLMSESPGAVHIRSPKKLWGSCHPVKRVIHFNWRIVMAPLEVIDYLVVHEMSHLKVANHSVHFWKRVETFYPDYRKSQIWLKQNGYQLQLPYINRYAR